MPILARCSCGGKVGVGDAMAGRTVRCPKCGEDILVSAAPPAAVKGGKGAKGAKGSSAASAPRGPSFSSGRKSVGGGGALSSSISVNPAVIAGVLIVALLLGTGMLLYFGPWRVSSNWAAMAPKANDDVTDVVQYGIQAYLANHGGYDPSSSHMTPRVDGPILFIAPVMNFSMPPKIVFHGKTNQGNFVGTYDPANGDIVADVETGGYSFAGMVDIAKATNKFHMTGREKNGNITAECNGAPLVMPPPRPRNED